MSILGEEEEKEECNVCSCACACAYACACVCSCAAMVDELEMADDRSWWSVSTPSLAFCFGRFVENRANRAYCAYVVLCK